MRKVALRSGEGVHTLPVIFFIKPSLLPCLKAANRLRLHMILVILTLDFS